MNALPAWRDLPSTLDGVALSHRTRAGAAPVLMVHGIGPGTTGRANFGPLLEQAPGLYALYLIDLAGFGASGRLIAQPYFDPGFWVRQIELALDQVLESHGQPPVLIGNYVGAALALKVAARRSELRRVLAIGAPAGGPAPTALKDFWRAPKDAASLARAMRPMTGPALTPAAAMIEARLAPFLQGDYGDYFDAMLDDPDLCLSQVALTAAEAGAIRAKVTVLNGRLDRACPADDLIARLLPLIPDADVTLLGGCGHNVIAERTAEVLSTVERLVAENKPK